MFIASVRPSVRPSVCLKPKFGRLKTKFDDDAGVDICTHALHALYARVAYNIINYNLFQPSISTEHFVAHSII